jgi:hypothetical protein
MSRSTNDAKQQQAGAAAGAPNAGPWSSSSASSSSSSSSAAAPKYPSNNYVFCMSCRAGNLSTETVCGECGFFLEGPMRPAAPTLAQRRGLGQAPAQMDAPIVRSEWEVIEARLVNRKDATCPICMEGFNQGYEVLLSCSHIFHRSCLESFEAFMGSRETRTCPICRKNNYQKKITKCGSAAWEESRVTLLQALYRGHLQRKLFYDTYFHKNYSYMPAAHGGGKLGVGLLRRRYLSQELTYLDNARKKEVDRVVSGIDATLTENQQLDALFDQMLRNRQTYHDVTGTSEAEAEAMDSDERRGTSLADGARDVTRHWSDGDGGDDDGDDDDDGAKDGGGGKEGEVKYTISEEEWPAVVAMACQRGLGTCSICLCNNKGLRGLSLLSCSHLFHSTCLLSFMRFAKDRKVSILLLLLLLLLLLRLTCVAVVYHHQHHLHTFQHHLQLSDVIILFFYFYFLSLPQSLSMFVQQRSGCPLCRSPFCTKTVSTNFEILGS